MKLHIGCGKKYLPGYNHMDVINYDHVDFVCDARKLDMLKDATVSEIYACHILEHVGRFEVSAVLKEWTRVMKPNGIIRIAVPDFEGIVDEYLENKDLMSLQGPIFGGQTYDYNFHHIAFDYKILKSLLEEAGLYNIFKYDWRDFLPEGHDDFSRSYLPHMDFENGRLISLNVMATKK